MDTSQKRDRDRKKRQRREDKAVRKKQRAEQKALGILPGEGQNLGDDLNAFPKPEGFPPPATS